MRTTRLARNYRVSRESDQGRLHRGADRIGQDRDSDDVAERLGAEIVNADSRQLYIGMDIGTAKPSAEDRRRVPHHLIDVRAPDQPLDVAEFVALARAAIFDISRRGRPVLVVGGSGFYLRALRGGIFEGPPASPEIRARVGADSARSRVPFLHDELSEIDPASASRIQRNDLYRIVRALEVHRITAFPISVHQERHRFSAREFDCSPSHSRFLASSSTRIINHVSMR